MSNLPNECIAIDIIKVKSLEGTLEIGYRFKISPNSTKLVEIWLEDVRVRLHLVPEKVSF